MKMNDAILKPKNHAISFLFLFIFLKKQGLSFWNSNFIFQHFLRNPKNLHDFLGFK